MICSAERAIGRHRHSGAPTAGTGSETVLSGDGLHQRPSGGIRLRIRFLGGHALDVGVFEGIPVGLDVLHQIVGGFVAGGGLHFDGVILGAVVAVVRHEWIEPVPCIG